MEIQVGVAKVGKYASSKSGDTLEMVERPHGGLSLVLVDGQRSGKGAKAISNMVAGKVISLLAEGIRDGAAARAAHDFLYTRRGGKVSATLNIVSIDMMTKTIVLSRNNHCPMIIQWGPDQQELMVEQVEPLGVHRVNKPQIREVGVQTGMTIVVYTDGIHAAGERSKRPLDVSQFINDRYNTHIDQEHAAQSLADDLLAEALDRDEGRPRDDMSVLVVTILERQTHEVRRMSISLPVPPLLRP